MPVAPTPLAGPTAGLQLSEVLIGRGTQNYTCADSTAQSMPVSIGAVANLYNASCIAGNYPDLLALLPNVTLQLPVPAPESTLFPPNIDLVGHHFFTTITEPTFNLDTNTGGNLGIIFSSKNGTTTAPPNSPKGQDDQGFGSVAWLKLVAKNGTVGGYQEVYRVNTAGGNPPATCDGMQPTFEVQYAAQYWMYV
ncbi:MAG: hypothetical protein M1827_003404 [Pycnora praestabilis]|nr:MAG: hypothetical protein M1827_003404 [Pycnora praestabilis]